jgi:hypothetical protein
METHRTQRPSAGREEKRMSTESIQNAIAQATEYLRAHRDEARYTDSVATARIVDGLRCRIEGPSGELLETDMPAGVGGGGSAPSPGWFLRAATAGCVASLATMRAAQLGAALADVQVEVVRLAVDLDLHIGERGAPLGGAPRGKRRPPARRGCAAPPPRARRPAPPPPRAPGRRLHHGAAPACAAVLADLRDRYDAVLERLESAAGWQTTRITPYGDLDWIPQLWLRTMRNAIVQSAVPVSDNPVTTEQR